MIDLNQWRTRLGLTVPEMARYIGVPMRTYQNWERGDRQPGSAGNALFDILAALEALCPDLHNMRVTQALNGSTVTEEKE